MVKVRPARGNSTRWEVDIRFRWPTGEGYRERVNAPVTGRSNAQRWAEARERELLLRGPSAPVPLQGVSFNAFWSRVEDEHYRAERKKASTLDSAETIFRVHLAPKLGPKALHSITTADVTALKARLAQHEPKTVNNVLSVLSRILRCAVEWGVLATMPVAIKPLSTRKKERSWYERDVFRRLIDAAKSIDPRVHLLVLLGGSAGLRRGEIRALKWSDLDLNRGVVQIRRAFWQDVEDVPKGGGSREVPLTRELVDALRKHVRVGERVLYNDTHDVVSNGTIRSWLLKAESLAGIIGTGGAHVLRHSFCSHLAAAGVPARAIQDLAGHADLQTTMRYMHLAPNDRGLAMKTLGSWYEKKD